jgi:two-component system cell cycle sensor histidine kinase/response regulator CckA
LADFVASEHYADPTVREKMLASLIEKGEVNDLEACFSQKDGEEVWTRFSARVYPEDWYLEGVGYDITEEKRALEALRESEQKHRTLTDSSLIGVFINQDDKYVFVNDRFAEMHGYEAEELLGKDHLDLIHPDEREIIRERTDKRLKGEKVPLRYDIRRLKKDGEAVWHEILVSHPITYRGRPAIMGHEIDISERKQAEEEKARLEAQLLQARKMEAIGLLAGGVAHDLNNILSGIVGYPDLLLLDLPKSSPMREPIEVIKESGQRAADVVSDLLTVARGIASVREVSNLNLLVEEYLGSPEHKRLKSMRSSVAFETVFEAELLNISCSPVHIKKSLMNLVNNASEAIEGSGTVTLSTENRYLDEPLKGYEDVKIGEYVVLSVSDNGTGISGEDLERIFEPFYTKKIMGRRGTGLGLAVVWNTVQDHHGYTNVRSDEKGTVFELYFPVTREEIAHMKHEVPIADYLGQGERILVVDDERRQREIACGLLRRLGYQPEAVSSGEEAIEYLKEHPVDLIVLDMIMPKGINGLETYEEILKIRPGQKAIIATGFSETEDVKTAQRLGAGNYIKKPYTLIEIGLALKEVLEKQVDSP